jgi:polysaccharide export outer membrane protein
MKFFAINRCSLVSSLCLLLAVSACVPNRKFVYLQKNDVNKQGLAKDSVVRTYDLNIREYRIQPLDILSIRIESLTTDDYDFIAKLYPNTQQLTAGGGGNNIIINGFLVSNEGFIEFPVVGKLKFSGLSVFQAQEMLKETFKPFLKDPVARVTLLNFRFTVIGEVNIEQQVTSINTRVTLAEAIALAGGLTDLADRQNIKLIRQKGDRAEVFYINLLDESLLASNLYYVQQNDLIVVPALRQRPVKKYWGQNVALLISTVSAVSAIVLTITTLNWYNSNGN